MSNEEITKIKEFLLRELGTLTYAKKKNISEKNKSVFYR